MLMLVVELRDRKIQKHQFTVLWINYGRLFKMRTNTMFNTGSVVGVSANIFGSGFPRNFIPSFSWGGNQDFRYINYIGV